MPRESVNVSRETMFGSIVKFLHSHTSRFTSSEPSLLNPLHRFRQSLFRRTDGHPDISFARRAEAVARRRHDSGLLQQVSREGSGGVSLRHRDPDVERSRRWIDFKPKLFEGLGPECRAVLDRSCVSRLSQNHPGPAR